MDDIQELFAGAAAARANAYAPYSGFTVGACLRSASGALFIGCNVENAAYPEGMCAEAAALAAMAAAGERQVAAIAIVGGPADGPARHCLPCGGCRQKLHEFAAPDGDVAIYATADADPVMLSALLPDAFGPADLGPADPDR